MQHFYSNGKLLITAEYLVLDGAVALAVPTKFGQSLEVTETKSNKIVWQSYNVDKECWFSASFDLIDFNIINEEKIEFNNKVSTTLQEILRTAKKLNPNFIEKSEGLEIKTSLSFPNQWGLGTSSTLINNIASWANVNAFELLEKSFGGSGYDIACAQKNYPITYQKNGIKPDITKIVFDPPFKDELFFVYLNQKQDSKEGINMYRSLSVNKHQFIADINNLTQQIINATNINEFATLLNKHEMFLSNLLGVKTVKEKLFTDFNGAVKSLGAWGGDFVLVTGTEEYVTTYFNSKNYTTIIAYKDMVLS